MNRESMARLAAFVTALLTPAGAAAVQRGCFYLLVAVLPVSKAAIEITVPVLILAWVVEHAQTGWTTSIWRAPASRVILLALVTSLAVCVSSVLTSTIPALSLQGLLRKTLEYVFLFIVVADVAKTPSVALRGMRVMVWSAALIGLDALWQELVGWDALLGHPWSKYNRMTGPYESPADLATYFLVVIPLVLMQAIWVRGRARWVLGVLATVLVGCLIRTEAVSAQAAWGGALVLLVGLACRWTALVLGVLVLGVAGMLGLLLQGLGYLPAWVPVSDVGVRDRFVMWQAAWQMIQVHPFLGHGLNTFMATYLDYWVGGEMQPRYAHNCFLQLTAELGIAGLAAFVWQLGAMAQRWWQALVVMPAGRLRAVLLALVAGLAGFLAQSWVDTNFYSLRQVVLFWTLAGVATGLSMSVLQPNGAPRERSA